MVQRKKVYDDWVNQNYSQIVVLLKSKNILNEDALHDALLSVYDKMHLDESITHSELGVSFEKEYRRYDKIAYFAIKQYLHFDSQVLDLIVSGNVVADDCESADNTACIKKTCNNIKRIVIRLCLQEDFELLTLYETNESITIKSLSLYTGMSQRTIYHKLQRLKKTIRANYSNYKH